MTIKVLVRPGRAKDTDDLDNLYKALESRDDLPQLDKYGDIPRKEERLRSYRRDPNKKIISNDKRWELFADALVNVRRRIESNRKDDSRVFDDLGSPIRWGGVVANYKFLYRKKFIFRDWDELKMFCVEMLRLFKAQEQARRTLWAEARERGIVSCGTGRLEWNGVVELARESGLTATQVSADIKRMCITPPEPRHYGYYLQMLWNYMSYLSERYFWVPLGCEIPRESGHLPAKILDEIREKINERLDAGERKLLEDMACLSQANEHGDKRLTDNQKLGNLAIQYGTSLSTLKRRWRGIKDKLKDLEPYLYSWKYASSKSQKIGNEEVAIYCEVGNVAGIWVRSANDREYKNIKDGAVIDTTTGSLQFQYQLEDEAKISQESGAAYYERGDE